MCNQLEIVRDSRKEVRDDIDETITQQRCKKSNEYLLLCIIITVCLSRNDTRTRHGKGTAWRVAAHLTL